MKDPKTVLITGASSGIGASLAKVHARRGDHIILAARREDRLISVSKACEDAAKEKGLTISTLVKKCDVTKPEELKALVVQSMKQFGRIDVVYANAGFGVSGKFETLNVNDYRRQFETNVFGVLNTAYACLDALKQSHGHFAIIGSVNSYVSLPKTSPYCMSKFAVRAFAEATLHELKPYGIKVSLICPGLVESEIQKVDNQGVYRPEADPGIPNWLIMDSEKAANQIVDAVSAGRREKIITQHGRLAIFIKRHFPWAIAPIAANWYKTTRKKGTPNRVKEPPSFD